MSEKKIDRKIFITWTLTAVGTAALGCSAGGGDGSNAGDGGSSGAGGNGGAGGDGASGGGSSGAAGMSTSGAGGVAGNGGSGQTAGHGGGGQAGNGGGSGGNGGQIAGGGNGGGGAGNNPEADCSSTINVTITSNHMHTLDVTLADITVAATKAYETGGTAPHTHWVELTAEDFVALQSGATIRKISCDDDHEHEYYFQCFADTPVQTPGIFDVCFEPETMGCGDLGDNVCPTPS